MLDANVVVFDAAYDRAVDADDAVKYGNPGANFAIETGSKILAIEGTQPVKENDAIQFRMWNLQQQDYRLEFATTKMEAAGMEAVLEDSYLKTTTAVNLKGSTTVNFTVTADGASKAANRFRIAFRKVPVTVDVKQGYTIAPNPVTGRQYELTVQCTAGRQVQYKDHRYERPVSNDKGCQPCRWYSSTSHQFRESRQWNLPGRDCGSW
ncbi:MAG: hypothetical protein IPP72_15375 [Chitinophagaceae bacterium]|nr:hypothetical protein [Chitinophagaceae bacterium]